MRPTRREWVELLALAAVGLSARYAWAATGHGWWTDGYPVLTAVGLVLCLVGWELWLRRRGQ